MRLSILDQSPVSAGSTPVAALASTLRLARRADELGYTRYWIAEHHAMPALASTAPEILIARIAGETDRIRVGSGAVLMPYYAPLKVAETFRMLHALAPDRIDLGLGRAPGGAGYEIHALQRHPDTGRLGDDFVQQVVQLRAFLDGTFPEEHPYSRILVSPAAPGGPQVWMLGSSTFSADLAGRLGLPYAFAHFIDATPTPEALALYRARLGSGADAVGRTAIVALGVVCAETDAEAERLFATTRLFRRRIRRGDPQPLAAPDDALAELGPDGDPFAAPGARWPGYVVGAPDRVKARLDEIAEGLGVEELMVLTVVFDPQARIRSYELLAEAYGLPGA